VEAVLHGSCIKMIDANRHDNAVRSNTLHGMTRLHGMKIGWY
jgi:hypothetical protein